MGLMYPVFKMPQAFVSENNFIDTEQGNLMPSFFNLSDMVLNKATSYTNFTQSVYDFYSMKVK